MLHSRRLALTLIQETLLLLKREGPILASKEDADYFRKTYAKPKPVVKAEPVFDKVEAPSPPVKAPIPKVEAPPPPPVVKAAPVVRTETPKMETLDFRSMRNLFERIAPGLPILDEPPSDFTAKQIANRWKTKNKTAPISILSFHEPKEQRALLEEIVKAIDVYFGPAKIVEAEPIEKEKQWEALLSVSDLKIILACDYTLWQLSHLMTSYKENPTLGTRTLGKVPLFLLPDLSLYLKDPLLKRSLWKSLCLKLSS